MGQHLSRELDQLKRRILSVSALVEESVRRSVRAVTERDVQLAAEVIEGDRRIDQLEVDVEEECLKILALHQPVAIDLRFIIAVLKMNNDLERIGDLAVNIAERGAALAGSPPVRIDLPLSEMAAAAQRMLRRALDAVINLDADLARQVCVADDEVDALNHEVARRVKDALRRDPEAVEVLVQLLLVARHVERIADQATNVAEDAIYMVEGRIARHRARPEDR